MSESEKVRIQVMVEPETSAKIDELADRLKISKTALVAKLIDCAIEDNEWMIRFATSSFMAPIREWVKSSAKRGGKGKEATA